MKTRTLLPAVMILFCLPASLRAADAAMKTYQDKGNVFSIQYPADWKVQETKPGVGVTLGYESPDGTWASNVVVNTLDVPVGNEAAMLATISSNLVKNLGKSVKDFKLIASDTIDYQGGKAQRITFSGTQDKVLLRFIQFVGIRNGKAILITCTTTAGKIEQETPKFDKLIDSFHLAPAK